MGWNRPTSRQINYLNTLGYSRTAPRSKPEACLLIDMLGAGFSHHDAEVQLLRVQAGLPTQFQRSVATAPQQSSGSVLLGCMIISGVSVMAFFLCCGGFAAFSVNDANLPVQSPSQPAPEVVQLPPEPQVTAPVQVSTVEPTPKAAEAIKPSPVINPDPIPLEITPPNPPPLTKAERIDSAKWRTWTATTGNFTVDAKFLRFGAGKVTLEKRDGKIITVDLSILIEDDGAFIREQRWMKAGE